MNKLKQIAQDVGLLLVTGGSALLLFFAIFCGMAGPGVALPLMCRVLGYAYFPLICIHSAIVLLVIIDILIILLRPEKRLLNGRRILSVIFALIAFVAIVYINFELFDRKSRSNYDAAVRISTNEPEEIYKGIIVTSVEPYHLVTLPITIKGYLDGNGWVANESEVGTAEVFDANGKSISNEAVIMTTSNPKQFPTFFQATVGDREKMSHITTENGIIKITSPNLVNNEDKKVFIIPVKFK